MFTENGCSGKEVNSRKRHAGNVKSKAWQNIAGRIRNGSETVLL